MGWWWTLYSRYFKIYKNDVPLDPSTYNEESNGVFFNFNTPPSEEDSYTDYTIKYAIRADDYAFSTGSEYSDYPGEEYFLFPNWNDAAGCGDAFWIAKYASSNENNIPVSKFEKLSWYNISIPNILEYSLSKGDGFHCVRNREFVSIALWTEIMDIPLYGNINGYNNGSNIDGNGTSLSMCKGTNYNQILTGSGPLSFRHNGRMSGISDLVGNVAEVVDGFQLHDGVPYVYDENNTNYIELDKNNIIPTSTGSATWDGQTYQYINNNTKDLLNEGLPIANAGMSFKYINNRFWKYNSGTYIVHRGGFSGTDIGGRGCIWTIGMGLALVDWAGWWGFGFRLAKSL